MLTAKGLVVNIQRPKHDFSVATFTQVLAALWTKDDLIFIPERCLLQYTLFCGLYYWTGARLSAFFTEGFRYGVSSRHVQSPVA
jgi:hypothetical protein